MKESLTAKDAETANEDKSYTAKDASASARFCTSSTPPPSVARRKSCSSRVLRAASRIRSKAVPGAPSRNSISPGAGVNFGQRADLLLELLDGGSVENVGCGVELGPTNFRREDGWFQRAVFGHPEWPAELQYTGSRFDFALSRSGASWSVDARLCIAVGSIGVE